MDVAVTCMVASVALVAMLALFAISVKADKLSEQKLVASGLASGLLAEIQLRKWDEAQSSQRPWYPVYAKSVIGPDAGEDPSDKRTFDDVDDFNGWTENPPRDPAGRPLPALSAYSRSAAVSYVTSALEPSGSFTSQKLVTACASHPRATRVCLDWLAAQK